MLLSLRYLSLLLVSYRISPISGDLEEKLFPKNFKFGVGSSAYQTEGSVENDGKGDNIWDHYISQLSTNFTDISNESYRKFKEDVALIAKMKLKFYKFSLSWSRILPSGFNDSINPVGITYYKNLIEELETHNITPIVTIYHWDLPQPIQELGGWTNTSIINSFVDYARVVFQNFDTVRYWLTMHEPKQICRGGYGDGSLAPFISDSGIQDYQCVYVVLRAHAAVYRMYRTEFPNLDGRISIALDGSLSVPSTNSRNDVSAARRRNAFEFGLYADPIFRSNGNWPNTVIQILNGSNYQGEPRLPKLTRQEIIDIRGTADFLALNYYEARVVQYFRQDSVVPSYEQDMRMNISKNSTWPEGANGFTIVPWSIRSFLSWIKTEYRNPEIIITGNGVADDGSLHDTVRVDYMMDYLSNVLDAIHIDNVNVTGYIFWSLLDGFEWTDGYNLHFGLYSVDRNSTERTRTAKDSAGVYCKIATEYAIPSLTPESDATTTGRSEVFTTTTGTDIPEKHTNTDSPSVFSTTPSGSNTILICSYMLLAVSILFLIFCSNGLFIFASFLRSSLKIV